MRNVIVCKKTKFQLATLKSKHLKIFFFLKNCSENMLDGRVYRPMNESLKNFINFILFLCCVLEAEIFQYNLFWYALFLSFPLPSPLRGRIHRQIKIDLNVTLNPCFILQIDIKKIDIWKVIAQWRWKTKFSGGRGTIFIPVSLPASILWGARPPKCFCGGGHVPPPGLPVLPPMYRFTWWNQRETLMYISLSCGIISDNNECNA